MTTDIYNLLNEEAKAQLKAYKKRIYTIEDRSKLLKIGGSDLAAICGLSPWLTEYDVYARLSNIKSQIEEKNINAMKFGNLIEEHIFNIAVEKFDILKDCFNFSVEINQKKYPISVLHEDIDYLTASLDGGNIKQNYALEIKSTSSAAWDSIPFYYQTQAQWYLELLNLDKCYFVVYHIKNYGDRELISNIINNLNNNNIDTKIINKIIADMITDNIIFYELDRDKDVGSMLVKVAVDFYQKYVNEKKVPEVVNINDINKYITSINKKSLIANNSIFNNYKELSLVKEQITSLTAKAVKLTDQIKLSMAESELLYDSELNVLATFKTSERRTLNSKKIKDLIARKGYNIDEYQDVKKIRTFLLK